MTTNTYNCRNVAVTARRKSHANDPLGVQAQKGRPAQVTSRSAPRTPRQILPHGSWRNLNSQFQKKLIGNAFLTPRRILIRHPTDDLLKLERNRRTTRSRHQPPKQLPTRV